MEETDGIDNEENEPDVLLYHWRPLPALTPGLKPSS